jgi:hypothetical protein
VIAVIVKQRKALALCKSLCMQSCISQFDDDWTICIVVATLTETAVATLVIIVRAVTDARTHSTVAGNCILPH